MSTDIMGHFSPLDEMIQLIYQNIYQFVVMSSVMRDKWTVHVGMVGDAGRWWRGAWEEKDVVSVVGPKPSEQLLETFVDKLVNSIISGELYLVDFSAEKGAKVKLAFGPTSTKPVSMALEEIGPAEAAAHATNVFLEIALQAQSRKCRLHPSAFTSMSVTTGHSKASIFDPRSQGTRIDAEKEGIAIGGSSTSNHTKTTVGEQERDVEMKEARHDMERLKKAEKETPKRLLSPPEKTQPSVKIKAPVHPPVRAGASLANPNKKARKIQAIEFESDDE